MRQDTGHGFKNQINYTSQISRDVEVLLTLVELIHDRNWAFRWSVLLKG